MSAITESASGEYCRMRLAKVCNHDATTTVWAHANGSAAGKGSGMKASDLLGAYLCFACHNVYDRRVLLPSHLTRQDVELAFWHAHARSLVALIEKGLVYTSMREAA